MKTRITRVPQKKYVFRPPPPLIPPFFEKLLKEYIILRTWPSQFHNSLFLMADGLYFESVSCCYVFKRISKKHFGIFFLEKFLFKVKKSKTVCVIYYNYLFTFLTHI